jgi:glycosyltransferase involved in cell wall biosynthesis
MRILHIIPNLRKGGAERLALDICASLSTRPGMQVRLISLHNLMQYDVAESGVDVKVIPASIRISPIRPNKLNVAALQQEVESFQPDIIHSHLFEAEVVSRSIDYPVAKWFSHCHDNMHQLETFYLPTLFDKKLLTEFYERIYLLRRYRKNGSNRFIAISRDVEKYFKRVLPDDLRNITLLSNAVHTAKFRRPEGYERKKIADLELVTVGSLVSKKNQTFLLDVVKKLQQKKYNVHLHVLGDGVNRKMLEAKTKSLRLTDYVTFHGNVTNVQQFLWNSDMYVHAATYEPFGLVLVEAMAAGLPVISLDGRGNRDIIKNHKNGFILEKQSVTDFADKIGLLFHDKFKYNQMQAAGFETAAKLDIVPYTDKLIELYEAALNS